MTKKTKIELILKARCYNIFNARLVLKCLKVRALMKYYFYAYKNYHT